MRVMAVSWGVQATSCQQIRKAVMICSMSLLDAPLSPPSMLAILENLQSEPCSNLHVGVPAAAVAAIDVKINCFEARLGSSKAGNDNKVSGSLSDH